MDRYDHLLDLIRSRGGIAVAYSGGVDSSFLALAAREALGDDCVAMMVVNGSIPGDEVETARCAAEMIGIRFLTVEAEVLENSSITDNPSDRCGICKSEIMRELMDRAIREGFRTLADGSMPEDRMDHRPGLEASSKIGVWHPLMEAGIDKELAREVLRRKGIPTHDRPSTTCLMTRIPYGEKITEEKLSIVEDIEARIRENGFREVRLRLHTTSSGNFLGVLEVDDPMRAMGMWRELDPDREGLKIVLDPLGYRQGSLNRTLSTPQGL